MSTPLRDALPDLTQFIILGYRGSHAHGMFVPSTDPDSIDDVDVMGVVVPPLDTYFGLHSWHGRGTQEIKLNEWDIVNYEIRKTFGMLLGSNPNMAALLWADEEHYLVLTSEGQLLRDRREIFSSKKAYHTFSGYAHGQLKKLETPSKEGYMGAKREALFKKFGYDTKNATHCIRLLRMGTEFLTDGILRINRQGIDADELLSIKRGEWSIDRVRKEAEKGFAQARAANESSPLPEEPDHEAAHELLMEIMYRRFELGHICRWCRKEIDPDWCWCGDAVDKHGYFSGHTAVPMGCGCGYLAGDSND